MHADPIFTEREVESFLSDDDFVVDTPAYNAEKRRRFRLIADKWCCITKKGESQYREKDDWDEPLKMADYNEDGTLKQKMPLPQAASG